MTLGLNNKTRSLISLLLLGWTGIVLALPSTESLLSYDNDFGYPASDNDLDATSRYLGTSIDIVQNNSALISTSAGRVMFSQSPSSLLGGLPMALGRLLAVRSTDSVVSVFSGLSAISEEIKDGSYGVGTKLGELPERGDSGFGFRLRLFDETKTAWVNPVLLMQFQTDSAPPRIESMVLRRGKTTVDFSASPKGRISLSQGTYAIFVRAFDIVRGSASSGIFRYRILLDGQVVLDRRMDAAQATGNGMAFMGLAPPSSSHIDEKERLGLGDIDLPRGQHLLEIFVFDFSGNQAQAAWRVNAE